MPEPAGRPRSAPGMIDRIRTAVTLDELELLKSIADNHTGASPRTKRTVLAEYQARKQELINNPHITNKS